MKTLKQDIETNQFKNMYLLYGEELYIRDQYASKLKEALVPSDDTVNLTVFEGKNIAVTQVIDQAETMPFFSDRRLIYVKNSGFFKEAQPDLAKYMETVPETTYFLFVETEIDKRNKLFKTVSTKGRAVEFVQQTEEMLKTWIARKIKAENKKVTASAVDAFLEMTGTDMNLISMELEKLLTYTLKQDSITKEDVEHICTEQTTNKIFDMVSAISDKNQRKALDLYYDLLALKEPPMRILFLIAKQLNLLFQVKELSGQGYSQNVIVDKLGSRGFIIRNASRQAEHFSLEKLKSAVETCVQTETDVKTGKLSDKLAVELIIIQMSGK